MSQRLGGPRREHSQVAWAMEWGHARPVLRRVLSLGGCCSLGEGAVLTRGGTGRWEPGPGPAVRDPDSQMIWNARNPGPAPTGNPTSARGSPAPALGLLDLLMRKKQSLTLPG